MSPVQLGVLASALPLVVFGVVGFTRWRLVGGLVVVMSAFAVAFNLGIVGLSDIWAVPLGVGMTEVLVLAVLWMIFGALARTAGPISVPGPPWLSAMVMGATLGEVPAAAILSAGAASPAGAARLALCAAGGGMLGRLGDPAMLIIAHDNPAAVVAIFPLGLVCAWLARPRQVDLFCPEDSSPKRTIFVLGVAVVAAFPGLTFGALAVGICGLAFLAKDSRETLNLSGLLWQILAISLALLAVVGGLAELAAQGLETVVELLDWWAPPLLVASCALLTALSDATAMSVLMTGVVDRSMSLDSAAVVAPMAVGVAVGGLGPLLAAGALRAGWRLWVLQVAVAVLWACAWAYI
jgi:hypothetical protein